MCMITSVSVTDEIYLLCKGAEMAILDRVSLEAKNTTLQHVTDYAVVCNRVSST